MCVLLSYLPQILLTRTLIKNLEIDKTRFDHNQYLGTGQITDCKLRADLLSKRLLIEGSR